MEEKNKFTNISDSGTVFKSLLDSSPDCIKLFDLEGDLFYINRGGLREHKLDSLEEALERNWQAIETVVEEDREKFAAALKDAVLGKTTTIEIMHTIAGSTRDSCSEVISPVTDENGKIVAVLGISRDISRLKKAETELTLIKRELKLKIREQNSELKDRVKELEKFNNILTEHEKETDELKRQIEELKNAKQ